MYRHRYRILLFAIKNVNLQLQNCCFDQQNGGMITHGTQSALSRRLIMSVINNLLVPTPEKKVKRFMSGVKPDLYNFLPHIMVSKALQTATVSLAYFHCHRSSIKSECLRMDYIISTSNSERKLINIQRVLLRQTVREVRIPIV